ncbi:MAG: DUF1573 domain-containing protein [Microgenomates group bacterium]|jgi:hypothetical protein
MSGEKKLLFGIILSTVIILVGAIFFLTKSTPAKIVLEKTTGAKSESLETNYDFKNIAFSGGDAIHEFKIKNIGDKDLQIANLATSCHCTKVYFKSAKEVSPRFGMKGSSSASDWVGILSPGEEGQVVADFDPTYHGPQGVGPISRIVSIETNDPDKPYMEFNFSGNVVK